MSLESCLGVTCFALFILFLFKFMWVDTRHAVITWWQWRQAAKQAGRKGLSQGPRRAVRKGDK